MKPKLIMICLLRSSAAALATRSRGGNIGGEGGIRRPFRRRGRATVALRVVQRHDVQPPRHHRRRPDAAPPEGDRPPLAGGHIAFRLARRADVPQIQSCNLATLPENYNANFYVNHMRRWPQLTLVAEHVPDGCQSSAAEDRRGDDDAITPLSEYLRGADERKRRGEDPRPRKEIVGYILGKVEERPLPPPPRQVFPPSSRVAPLYDDRDTLLRYGTNGNLHNANGSGGRARFPSPRRPPAPLPIKENAGHVTSLAVCSHARRLGIASSLLRQLHYHLRQCHGANSIGLHVRVSNDAAVGLYAEDGYDVADVIAAYYGDGEDAYFMRKMLVGEVATTVAGDAGDGAAVTPVKEEERRKWRRGEKERRDWFRGAAAPAGSSFDVRRSTRDLTEDERVWVSNNSSPQISSQFKRGLRTFFNNDRGTQRQVQPKKLPPWETGPEGLRLPRYARVDRSVKETPASGTDVANSSKGMSLKGVVVAPNGQEGGAEDYTQTYNGGGTFPVEYA